MASSEIEVLQAEIRRLQQQPISQEERQFVLDLIRDARLHGLLEIEYKALRIRISPAAADNAHRQTYVSQVGGIAQGWSTKLPVARHGEP